MKLKLILAAAMLATKVSCGQQAGSTEPITKEQTEQNYLALHGQQAHNDLSRLRAEQIRGRPQAGPTNMVMGVVVKIYGNLSKSTNAVVAQPISQPVFGIHVQVINGPLYVIQIEGNRAYAIASLVHGGTRLRFPLNYYARNGASAVGSSDQCYSLFDQNRISCESYQGLPTWDQLIEIDPQLTVEDD